MVETLCEYSRFIAKYLAFRENLKLNYVLEYVQNIRMEPNTLQGQKKQQ